MRLLTDPFNDHSVSPMACRSLKMIRIDFGRLAVPWRMRNRRGIGLDIVDR